MLPTESDKAELVATRTTIYPDTVRACKVEVDGEVVARLRAHESSTILVRPGFHRIRLKIDWCGSRTDAFRARRGRSVRFDCGSSLAGGHAVLALFYIIFRRNRYLWLRRTA